MGGYLLGTNNESEAPATTLAAEAPATSQPNLSTLPQTDTTEANLTTSTTLAETSPDPEIVVPSIEFDLPIELLPTTQDPVEWVKKMEALKLLAYNDYRPDLLQFMFHSGNPNSPQNALSYSELQRIEETKEFRDTTRPNMVWEFTMNLYPERTTFPGTSNIISVDSEEFAWTTYYHHIIDYVVVPKDVVVEQNGQKYPLTLQTITQATIYCQYPDHESNECVLHTG